MRTKYLWVHPFHAAFYALQMENRRRRKIFNKQKLVQRHFLKNIVVILFFLQTHTNG